MRLESSEIKVSFFRNTDVPKLREQWCCLEQKSEQSFFLSWTWIGSWITTLSEPFYVLQVERKGELIGLGLFCEKYQGFSKKLYLHRTGVEQLDQIWIEYNDFLIHPRYADKVRVAIRQKIAELLVEYDQVIIGVSDRELVENYCPTSSMARVVWEAPGYGVDLKPLRESNKAYIQDLSRNTRSLIRRTKKKLLDIGEIALTFAASLAEAYALMDAIEPLHISRWGGEQGESGFLNDSFVGFHRSLIQNGWDEKAIHFGVVTVGGKPAAYFYNFCYKGCVYFYMGVTLPEFKKFSIGLVMHELCIEHYIQSSIDYYDFMAGDFRYKRSLASCNGELVLMVFERNNFRTRMTAVARKIKNSIGF